MLNGKRIQLGLMERNPTFSVFLIWKLLSLKSRKEEVHLTWYKKLIYRALFYNFQLNNWYSIIFYRNIFFSVVFEQSEKYLAEGSSGNYKRLSNHNFSMESSYVNCDSFSLKKMIPAFTSNVSNSRLADILSSRCFKTHDSPHSSVIFSLWELVICMH